MKKLSYLEFSQSIRGYHIYKKGSDRPTPRYVIYHSESEHELDEIMNRTSAFHSLKEKSGWRDGVCLNSGHSI